MKIIPAAGDKANICSHALGHLETGGSLQAYAVKGGAACCTAFCEKRDIIPHDNLMASQSVYNYIKAFRNGCEISILHIDGSSCTNIVEGVPASLTYLS